MAMTFYDIWNTYRRFEIKRRIYIKKMRRSGVYDTEWIELPRNIVKDSSINSIQRSLPNSSYQFGKVQVSNASMSIMSPHREMSDESLGSSLFYGYRRHWSQIKVVDSMIDKYTTEGEREEVPVTTFIGIIDATTATTEQGYETFTALDFITVLDEVNVSSLSLTETTLSALVYEILNREEFTKYFNVSSSTTYIDPGYDATAIDLTQYDGSVLEMLQDLAKGHSIFYVDPDDSYFYFKEALPTETVQYSFLEMNNKKISISKYKEGKDRQITQWYWSDTDPVISSIASAATPITENFDIKGITNSTQRQNTLDFVLNKTRNAKPYFKLELPFFPIVKILDKIQVQSYGIAPKDAPRWGMFKWTAKDTTNQSVAPRWTSPIGIKISSSRRWMVRSISHDGNFKTTLELEETS